jgi:hypothetical protein
MCRLSLPGRHDLLLRGAFVFTSASARQFPGAYYGERCASLWTLNITTIIAVAGIAATGLAAWITTLNRVAAHDAKIAAMDATQKGHGDRVEAIRAKSAQELADFKLEVAKNCATNTSIREVEERVVAAIERLGDRLDKMIDGQRSDRAARPRD